MVAHDLSKSRRMELILRQIDSLPTLPMIATRLLSLTARDDSRTQQVIDLVSADPPLTAKVLSLCRAADKGLRQDAMTIERAVLLLGFSAIRNAVLSVKVFEMFGGGGKEDGKAGGGERRGYIGAKLGEERGVRTEEGARFDAPAFWSHSLAVAVLAEQIAAGHRHDAMLDPSEAFVCGLLHDIGKLALHHVLPKSYVRVIETADLNHGNIAEFERRIVGIDHHTAGKRLAEQWGLPHRLADCIWLHGSTVEALPRLEHRRLVGLICLADLIARQHHVGYSGNYVIKQSVQPLAEQLNLKLDVIHQATEKLYELLEERCEMLGMRDRPSRKLFMQSMQRANEALGTLNQALDRRGRMAAEQGRVLEAIASFHAGASPAQSVQDVLDATVLSARNALGAGFYAMLYPGGDEGDGEDVGGLAVEAGVNGGGDRGGGGHWLICQYGADGTPIHSQYIEAPPHSPDLAHLDAEGPMAMSLMGLLPWIADYLVEAGDMRQVKLLPLACGWGTAAVMLHDREQLPGWRHLAPLTGAWGTAIAAAAQHQGARRLGEELAQSNLALAEAQDRLLRHESMVRLGQMAAGAAHEMNNPLAVISGRSQLLTMALSAGSNEHKAAQTIYHEAHRLSDLISCLHMFASPPELVLKPGNLAAVLDEAIKKVNSAQRKRGAAVQISLSLKHMLPPVKMDGAKVQRALTELLLNAVQANPKSQVQVVVRVDRSDRMGAGVTGGTPVPPERDAPPQGGGRAVVQVIDDGDGMDGHTLDHAMDPFFSAKAAGRRVGMGLPRARQLIQAHGGELELRSTEGEGTTATFTLPLDSMGERADRRKE